MDENKLKYLQHNVMTSMKKMGVENYISNCKENVDKTDFFFNRGFDANTIQEFDLGYDVENEVAVIPYSKSHNYFMFRNTEENIAKSEKIMTEKYSL